MYAKHELKKRVSNIITLDYISDFETEIKQLETLLNEICEDNFTIVVVGEFKRGKSTFVNALLGADLLPMDVLPETATLNALVYNTVPKLHIVNLDGSILEKVLSKDTLSVFSAQNANINFEDIRFLRMGYPSNILKNRVVLIDTPGVADLSEQRTEITYGVLPNANIIIFLLDAGSPLKKTEKEFLEKHILTMEYNNIIFIANKFDNIDEDEEENPEEILESIKKRLSSVLGNSSRENFIKNLELYPLSSKLALEGKLKDDNSLIEKSGLSTVEERLNVLLSENELEKKKITRYNYIYKNIVFGLISKIQNQKAIKSTNKENLDETLHLIEEMIMQLESDKSKVKEYIDIERSYICSMFQKSMRSYVERLASDIFEMIQMYKGSDFKEYVEVHVTKRIKREIEGWTGSCISNIDQLLNKIRVEVIRGICRKFNQNMNLKSPEMSISGESLFSNFSIILTAKDISNTDVHAGMIAAAGGLGLMMLAGGALMPFVSFAAMPFLRRSMLEGRLREAKSQLMPELQTTLESITADIYKKVNDYIDIQCVNIERELTNAYENALVRYKAEIEVEIKAKLDESTKIDNEVGILSNQIEELRNYL